MSLTYSTYKTALATIMVVPETDPDFLVILPECIAYAEGRIYREVDFLATRFRDSSNAFTANVRSFALPSNLLILEGINVITPAGQTDPNSGTRNPLAPVSRDYIDAVHNSTTGSGVPSVFAMTDQDEVIVGPVPAANYQAEVIGIFTPAPLASDNTETIITQNLPDCFLAASMVFMSGYLKNFGSQADDPQMAVSWEMQYKTLIASALTVEFRKKFESTNWTSKTPTPLSKPRN